MDAARVGGGEELLDHRVWLKQQHADFREHLRRKRQRPPPDRSAEQLEDFAVGSDIGRAGEEVEEQEEVVYRSVSIEQHFTWDEEHLMFADVRHGSPAAGDVAMFRSLDSLEGGSEGEGADESAAADWLATGRPPLLKRQRAFHRDSSWLGLTP